MNPVADLSSKRDRLEERARILSAARSFLSGRGYLEVETPVRVRAPALEDHIDAESSGDHWLRTSPELHLKRLMAAGFGRVFTLGPCFRRGERGERHLPEYTMLEWYHADWTAEEIMAETVDLIRACAASLGQWKLRGLNLAALPKVWSLERAYMEWAGWNPIASFDADRFDVDMAERIEPRLAEETAPVILTGFPAARSALARLRAEDERVADRCELYWGGMELANAYTELTDAAEQRRRFEACAAARGSRGQDVYPLDERFLDALGHGLPSCAGVALGMDRVAMRLLGAADIREVVAFPDG